MVEAMRKRGVEVEYIVQDNEGRGFRNDENKLEFHAAMGASSTGTCIRKNESRPAAAAVGEAAPRAA